ncbi:MAG TPA: hypothetical protein VF635_12345 [Propionibacteriaceae bacterium]
MPTVARHVRALTFDDLEWVLDISEQRRERLVYFGPLFWRPASDARDRHQAFLAQQIDDASVVSLRTDHGFVFAAPRGDLLDVDDMALEDDDLWPHDGSALLRSVVQRGGLRFVCPIPEPPRHQEAVDLGMVLVEAWWHRDLAVTSPPTVGGAAIEVEGASGRLVEAPPVYAPGGPVLVAFNVESGPALTALESAAASGGAVVSVVPRKPGQPTDFLTNAGYKRTTDFFVWHR